MDGVESATIVAAGAAALLGLLAAPAVGRQAAQWAGLGLARAMGRMQPFAGPAQVIDGDTIVVAGTRVRLYGIEAPDLAAAGGAEARRRLAALAGGGPVAVAPIAIDRYGRTVGRARRDGLDLSRAMVAAGCARAMPYWSFAYVGTELAARRARRGLWAAGPIRGVGARARRPRGR